MASSVLSARVTAEATSATSGSYGGARRLQAAIVIDLNTPMGIQFRQAAWDELKKLTDSLHIDVQLLTFEKLDFGETEVLDAFYNADVAIVDLSIRFQQSALCYHLGVRESMDQSYNIILYNSQESLNKDGVISPLKVTLRFRLVNE